MQRVFSFSGEIPWPTSVGGCQHAGAGYGPAYRARPLKRVIQRMLENELARRLLAGEFAAGDTIVVEVAGGGEAGVLAKGACC